MDNAIEDYFAEWCERSGRLAPLYALVDGLIYADAGTVPLTRSASNAALFDLTADASLAQAGPWLIDYAACGKAVRHSLVEQAQTPQGVNWLISGHTLNTLAEELRQRLDAVRPDGSRALLRFYDARVMHGLAEVLSDMQRIRFFVPVFEWLIQLNGELIRVHSYAA